MRKNENEYEYMSEKKSWARVKSWVESLSPESIEYLKTTLSVAIPVIQEWESRGYGEIPFSNFQFQEKGVPAGVALMQLDDIGSRANSEIKQQENLYTEPDGSNLRLSVLKIFPGETVKILKYTQQLVAKKLPEQKPIERPLQFIDKEAVLKINNISIQLPPHKNEHWFCQAAFEYSPNEPVDWDELYEKMSGSYELFFGKPKGTKTNWRKVYDTMEAINNRVVERGFSKIFTWQEKTIRRLY